MCTNFMAFVTYEDIVRVDFMEGLLFLECANCCGHSSKASVPNNSGMEGVLFDDNVDHN